MNTSNRILLNYTERYICIWRAWRISHGVYPWVSAASLRRINELITSGGVDDFTVEIEQPPLSPALPAHLARFAFIEVQP